MDVLDKPQMITLKKKILTSQWKKNIWGKPYISKKKFNIYIYFCEAVWDLSSLTRN